MYGVIRLFLVLWVAKCTAKSVPAVTLGRSMDSVTRSWCCAIYHVIGCFWCFGYLTAHCCPFTMQVLRMVPHLKHVVCFNRHHMKLLVSQHQAHCTEQSPIIFCLAGTYPSSLGGLANVHFLVVEVYLNVRLEVAGRLLYCSSECHWIVHLHDCHFYGR
jgi:hypothetical protein